MGNECFSSNSIKIYAKELDEINLLELKSQWSAIRCYKIKRIFEKLAHKPESPKDEAYLSFDCFCEIFPEFIRYEGMQKKRIYEIFDRSNNGYVNWVDFYDSISLCYFGDDKTLATIMFLIFDEFLDKRLDKHQLDLLVDLNANYLVDRSVAGSEVLLEPEHVVQKMLGRESSIQLERWLEKSIQFFDFKQFRRLFNIFKEQKLEKQLVQNFNEWNELYDQDQGKYVSYIISFKWFEAWKIYVENEYGIFFNIQEKNPITLKSIKTKKSLKTNNSSKSKRQITGNNSTTKLKLETANSPEQTSIHNQSSTHLKNKLNTPDQIRNYDMIRSVIGERPKAIYNNFIEGEYAGTIKFGLVENRDYVFVSEKVWNYLTEIYSGEPQFRRTGFDQIQLCPKIIRIYSSMFKGQIDYSSEIVREVSNNRTIEDLMTKSLEIDLDTLKNLSIFYRSFGMPTWQQISNQSEALVELTQSTIILLAYIEKKSRGEKQFRQKYLNVPKNIKEANMGDTLIYEDSSNKIEKQVIFFNRTVEGKYIIHFVGSSYVNDLCLNEKEFYKCCKINCIPDKTMPTSLKNHKIDKRRKGIENVKNLSFVIALILQFLESSKTRKLLDELSNSNQLESKGIADGKTYLTVILAYINRFLRASMHVDPRYIIYMMDSFFAGFKNFDITQVNSFINAFCSKIKEESQILKFTNLIRNCYEFTLCTTITCPRCKNVFEECEVNQCVLSVDILEPVEDYYQVIFVPFSLTISFQSIKKYCFQLAKNSTLKAYKGMLEKVADLQNKKYILLEIEGNTIIKNFNHIKDENVTLENLHLREDDNIYAFELCLDFSTFVKNHFSFSEMDNYDIEQKDLKVGEMIDCRSPEKGWICGKIVDKDIMPYTYQQNLKILHKFNNTTTLQSYKIIKNVVAFFPSQSYKNCEQYHFRLVQRVFSQANNEMINCHMPLIIPMAGWMRPRQFQYLVYLQVQRFIAPNHSFQGETVHTNFMGSSSIEKNIIRETTKMKVKQFKEYLYGKNLPYKLNYIDNNGHCLICYKFVKSHIFKGESENYCEGCSLSNDEPITWQIIVNDLVIAIDWKKAWNYRKDVIKNDSSYLNLSTKRRKDLETIESCLQKTLNQSKEICEMLCCNIPMAATVKRYLPVLPNFLILSLRRIVQQNGFKKNIKRPVYFGDENITVQGEEYELMGVIASKGHQNTLHYTTYIKESKENERSSRWLAYNGEKVEIIRKQEIDKRCTHVFFYQKIGLSKNMERTQIAYLLNKEVESAQQQQQNGIKETQSQTCSQKKCEKFHLDKQGEIEEQEEDVIQQEQEKVKAEKKEEVEEDEMQQKQIKLVVRECGREEAVMHDQDEKLQKQVSHSSILGEQAGLDVNLLKIPDDDFNISQF